MTLLVLFAAMAAVAVVCVVWPLLRRPSGATAPSRADYDLAIYKDQLHEVERERARGLLDETQAAAARLEIERRVLAAARTEGEVAAQRAPAQRLGRAAMAILAVLLLVPAAGLLYLHQGTPWLAGGERTAAQDRTGHEQFADLIGQLEQRLAEDPGDRRGWVLLARGYLRLGRAADAETAQRRALALTEDDSEAADVAAGFGQIHVEEAQGIVSPAALAAFRDALARDPRQPQARYFVGLAKLQAGNAAGAAADWRALLDDTPADAPWRAGLMDQIARLEGDGATPVPATPDSVEATAQREMIEGMVAGLAARLEALRASGGGSAAEWAQLGRSHRVLGRAAAARDAYAEAVKRAPDDSALWRDYAAAAAASDGQGSAAHRAVLQQWRTRLPEGSPERAAIDRELAR